MTVANNIKLSCIVKLDVQVCLGKKIKIIEFYVITQGNIILLGIPAIDKFELIIDIHDNRCYFNIKEKVCKKVEVNKESKQSNDKEIGQETIIKLPDNYLIQLTPAKIYSIKEVNKRIILIIKLIKEKNINSVLYQRLRVFGL